jgi:hypothetical protein
VHFSDSTIVKTIREQSQEEIIKRIKRGAEATLTNHQVIIVRKLRSGDLAVYMNSILVKKEIKAIID